MKSLLHTIAFVSSVYLPLFIAGMLIVLIAPSTVENTALSYTKIFWFTGALFVVTNAIGFLYGSPWHKEQTNKLLWESWPKDITLVLAYVSRGDNAAALQRAITASRLILEDSNVRYRIEAITDMPVSVGADEHILVPDSYATEHGAKFKARALHYASQKRSASLKSWVLHLDEESVITPALVHGLSNFFATTTTAMVIGQGEIKYNAHNYGKNTLITAIDSIRTGDDLGRFRLQYKMFGKPLFGMHGSFFLVNSKIEKTIGFDLGGKGSITEDAYFALIAADRGVKFKWIDGYIREQSPFTLMELLKQRRRWITGLRLLMRDKTINWQQRLILTVNMTLWRLAWIGPVVTIANLVLGGSVIPIWSVVMAAFTSGMIAAVYMVGAYRNVIDIDMHPIKQVYIWLAAGILMPISCAIEGLAVLYSIVMPNKTSFDVVNKN